MNDPTSAKRALRREMRALRRGIADIDGQHRSALVARRLIDYLGGRQPSTVMVYGSVPGEPDLAAVTEWCARNGIEVVVPDASPTASMPARPDVFDVVMLPGLAFTESGDRLGQGGGWFDRVVGQCRRDCSLVGVCYDEQVVATLPVESHDVAVDVVVTDRRLLARKELGSN